MKDLIKKIITEFYYFSKRKKFKKLSRKYKIPGGYKRIYHYHIRKTGGTSLNDIMLSITGEDGATVRTKMIKSMPLHLYESQEKIFLNWNKTLIERGEYYYAYSHFSAHTLNLPKDTFTVTVLRDPVKRVVSHYKMLLEAQKSNHNNLRRETKWLGRSFSDFLNNIPKENLLNQLYMFSANFDVNEAYQNITNCSHYFLTDNYAEGIDNLGKKLELNLKSIHSRKTTIKVKITTEEMQKLEKMLQLEMELYNRLKQN